MCFPTVYNVLLINITFILQANYSVSPNNHPTMLGTQVGTGGFGWGDKIGQEHENE